MAGNSGNQFIPSSYLTPNQQDLLMAALASNNPNRTGSPSVANPNDFSQSTNGAWDLDGQFGTDGLDPLLYGSEQSNLTGTGFDGIDETLNESPYLDLLDNNDANLDFNMSETADLMIGSLPESNLNSNDENREKRKSPERDLDDQDENETKRRDPDEKVAKKPGRKPLTSEPTNKRKAQNRAAQRAFRERKEKHLKDLETKVTELEKASEAANHENGLLKAQVDRLQIELREYRKRLSLNASTLGRSPPMSSGLSSYFASVSNGSGSNFQFEFPRFGTLPGGVFNGSSTNKIVTLPAVNGTTSPSSNAAPGVLARHDSNSQNGSPISQGRPRGSISSAGSPAKIGSVSSASGLSQRASSVQVESINNDGLAGLFNTSMMSGVPSRSDPSLNSQQDSTTPTETSNPQPRMFQFNSSVANSSRSPTASSVSQYGGNSSCGTSPEPINDSPSNGNKDASYETPNADKDKEVSFCDKLNMACGDSKNPIPRAMSMAQNTNNDVPNTATNTTIVGNAITDTLTAGDTSLKGIDWLAQQNGGQFEPILFGDYRDSQAAIIGDGDFTGGFFNDAMPMTDFASPFNWDVATTGNILSPPVQKANPLEQADLIQAGGDDEEEVVPGEDTSKMLSCDKIWNKLQDNPDFQNGSVDIDVLCTELRAKARCSESGVVINQKDVDAAFQRLPAKRS